MATEPDPAARRGPARLPLLAARDLSAPLAWRKGRPVSAGHFIAAAQALAARLPLRGRPVNLCQDRLRFALGLAAALLRGHTSLMPPNALPDTLQRLRDEGGQVDTPVYALTDDAAGSDLCGLPRVVVPLPADEAPATAIPEIDASLEAVCLLTSGSTGAPQPHGKRWGTLVLNIAAEAECLAQHLGQRNLVGLTVVATVPPQHSYGLESSVLLALLGGASFDAGRPFYPADVAAALAAVPEPRALLSTPFHLKTLLQAGVALPRTALTLSATAPLSPQLAAQAEAALQGPLVEIYGCTEAGQVASRRTTAGERWQTMGALRIERQTAADGEECFIVSGGHVAEPTALSDVLELDDARHFRLLGRANDLIHVAGKRSSLAHLNFHLNRIPGVDDGAFWLPDEVDEGVVRPVAFVVAPTLSAAQIIQALRWHLEPVFVPRRVLHVAALPRVDTGKLTAQGLRQFALQTLAAAAPAGSAAAVPALQVLASHALASSVPATSVLAPLAPAPLVPKSFVPASPVLASSAPATPVPASLLPTSCVPASLVPPVHITPDGGANATWPIAATHPAFDGHFPGRPLLPGAVLLSLVMETVAAVPALQQRLGAAPRVDNVKFLAPVGPGVQVPMPMPVPVPVPVQLQVRLRPQGSGVAFELLHGEQTVARGQLAGPVADPVTTGKA